MVNPGRKLKKIVLIMGISGAIYGGFRYLLPLVIPFLCAYGAALWLRPSVRFLEKRLTVRIRGKQFHVPAAVIGAAELAAVVMSAAGAVYWIGSRVWFQLEQLSETLPSGLYRLDGILTNMCRSLEDRMGLRRNVLVAIAREMVRELGSVLKRSSMPFLMNNSVTVLRWMAEVLIFLVLFFMATILLFQEMDEIRDRRDRSMFHREFLLIGKRLASVGSAWLKTEILIAGVTCALCTAGLFLMGNPYALVLGIGIGCLDALPLFGAGVILVPWAVVMILQKQWMDGVVLLGLYAVCYILRQFLEAKFMGDRVGLSPLETLVSIYVGLQLFGLAGVFLGPIGLLLIEDLVELYWNSH